MSQRGMNLGLFLQSVHRSEKPWAVTLQEDREAVLLADRLGLCKVWIGEYFSTRAEQIPSPLMFLAPVIATCSHFSTQKRRSRLWLFQYRKPLVLLGK